MELTPEAVEFINNFAKEGAKHDDRWLMLVMFGFLLVFGAAVIVYLVKSGERQRRDHAAELTAQRDSHSATQKQLTDVLLEQNTKLTEVVTRNTDAFATLTKVTEENNRVLGKVSER